MIKIENLDLPDESGIYKYLVFKIDDNYFLKTGLTSQGHDELALDFLTNQGQELKLGLIEVALGFGHFGGLGGGHLDWDSDKRHIIYHSGCRYGPPEPEDIAALMKRSDITYDAPLDDIVEKKSPPIRADGSGRSMFL